MDSIISLLFIGIYLFMSWTFTRGSLRTIREYIAMERQPWEIVEGTVEAFEEQRVGRPRRSGKVTVFYPVFSFYWGGKTYRNYGRRIPATVDRELRLVPRTRLRTGDRVAVRVFIDQPEKARIDEKGHFFRSQIPGHVLTVLAGMAMMAFGIYWAVSQFLR